MNRSLPDPHDCRKTEAERAAYRAGWTAARYLTDEADDACLALWPALLRRYPAADPSRCTTAFCAAFARQRATRPALVTPC